MLEEGDVDTDDLRDGREVGDAGDDREDAECDQRRLDRPADRVWILGDLGSRLAVIF